MYPFAEAGRFRKTRPSERFKDGWFSCPHFSGLSMLNEHGSRYHVFYNCKLLSLKRREKERVRMHFTFNRKETQAQKNRFTCFFQKWKGSTNLPDCVWQVTGSANPGSSPWRDWPRLSRGPWGGIRCLVDLGFEYPNQGLECVPGPDVRKT